MKMNSKIVLMLLTISAFVQIGCGGGKHVQMKTECKTYYDSLRNNTKNESLLALVPDAVWNANPELITLFDTLYQYVRNDSISKKITEENKWMNNYRKRLCAYFDKHNLGSDTISVYAKADTVINTIERLYDLSEEWTTMGMIVENSTMYSLYKFREFNVLSHIQSFCADEDDYDLLNQEMTLFNRVAKEMGVIAVNIVYLNYWGGSIVGPMATYITNGIINARIDMCQTILDIIDHGGWHSQGVYPDIAKKMLVDSCSKAIDDFYNNKDFYEERGDLNYGETVQKAKDALKEISPLLDEWLTVWDRLDEALTHDYSRHSIERAAAHMLYVWASLATDN